MSDIIQEYDLIDDPFSLCSVVWNEEQKKFIPTNYIQKFECCSKTSLQTIEECRKTCSTLDNNKYTLCMETCDIDLKNAVERNCKLIDYGNLGFSNPIYKGTVELGCGNGYYDKINIDCIKKNKNDIINICKNNCIETEKNNCNNHCNYSYEMIIDPSKNVLYNKNSNILIQKGYKSSSSSYIKIFGYSIGITLLFFLISITIIHFKSRINK